MSGLTSSDLMAALRLRYSPPSFAFLPQVPNGTGSHKSRTADALAMSLWPSRGLELFGFEVKVSRGDWLRELKEPAKADAIARYCDRWWVVAPDASIVKPAALPKGWGLLVMRGSGLAAKIEAALIETEPIPRTFLAAVLRIAARPTEQEIARVSHNSFAAGRVEGERIAQNQRDIRGRQDGFAQKAIADFEQASGVKINEWNAGRIGEAVKFVLSGRTGRAQEELKSLHDRAKRIYESLAKEIESLPPVK